MTLAQFLERHWPHGADGPSAASFAKELKVPPSTVSRWINRKRKPNTDSIIKIQQITGGRVRAADFLK
jgi:plasmid maintenance system antidote protein VapI